MDIRNLLNAKILGENFIAVNKMSETTDYKTKEVNGYQVNISIQDENSPAFMELITVKIRNLSPTLSYEMMKTNKTRKVKFRNLKIGVWNNQPTFSAEDILPYTEGK